MLLVQVREVFRAEPNLLELHAPIKVLGDVHGQYYDLCHLLEKAGCPLVDDRERYLFLGDYVDRGNFGTEVCLYLFALKLRDPAQVYLLRGNHECRTLTQHFNFRRECVHKYGPDTWELFMSVFDCLPLAALVHTDAGRFLCVHGGPSPGAPLLADLQQVDRFAEVPTSGVVCDLLWSDPLGEDTADGLDDDEMPEWFAVGFEPNPDRGCGQVFGFEALERFLLTNSLLCVVRGHEVQKRGYHEHHFHRRRFDSCSSPECAPSASPSTVTTAPASSSSSSSSSSTTTTATSPTTRTSTPSTSSAGCTCRKHPRLVTVFSAPNYCDMYGNQACVLTLGRNGSLSYLTAEAVPHPYYLRGLVDGLNYSLPFVLENLADLASRCFGLLGVDENPDLQRKLAELARIRIINEQIRAEQAALLREDALLLMHAHAGGVGGSAAATRAWEEALRLDHPNESRPGTSQFRSAQVRRHLRTF
jgi:serine/threonine-protein phosphatase 2B catalytic subunit